jgi:hypothetical protein
MPADDLIREGKFFPIRDFFPNGLLGLARVMDLANRIKALSAHPFFLERKLLHSM